MKERAKIRLHLDSKLSAGQSLSLNAAQVHYVLNVMRLSQGAKISLFNNTDGEWLASLCVLGKRKVIAVIEAQSRVAQAPVDLWLFFAPIKKARTDFIVEKATELGVRQIIPVQTTFSNAQRIRQERLQAHAIEAAEQCGTVFVPQVHDLRKLGDVLDDWPSDRSLFFCDEMIAGQTVNWSKQARPKAAILIGPEGGFSTQERAALQAMPAVQALSLGPRILRADTAAVVAITLWQYHHGDWGAQVLP